MSIVAGTETYVTVGSTTNEGEPIINARSDGGWIVTWTASDFPSSSVPGIFSQSYNADGSKDGEVVTHLTGTLPNHVSTAITASGELVVAYSVDDGANSDQIFLSDGTVVNSYTTGNQDDAEVTALTGGGYVVTWTSAAQDGSGNGIYQQRFTAAGAKDGDETLVNTTTTGVQQYSQVTALSDGGWVVTWVSEGQDGDSSGIYSQIYGSDGVKLGSEFRINDVTAGKQYDQAVTALSDNRFLVTWSSPDIQGYSDVYGRIFNADGSAADDSFMVNTETVSSQSLSDVAVLADGKFVVVWTSDYNLQESIATGATVIKDTGKGVYAQIFNPDGTVFGTEMLVNVTTSADQWLPSVTALEDGGWVVSWQTGLSVKDIAQRVYHILNDAPEGTDKTIALAGSSSTHAFSAADFGFSDVNGDLLKSVIITGLPDKGVLTLGGSAVTEGQAIDASQLGDLVFTPTDGTPSKSLGHFTFQVVDKGGSANGGQDTDQTANTITFTQNYNETPTGANNSFSVSEAGSKTFEAADFGFSDSDGGTLKAIIITSLPTTGSLTLNGETVTAGDTVAAGDIGNLVWTPNAASAAAGSDSFTFQVQDTGGTPNGSHDIDQSPNTIDLTVKAFNHAPAGANKTLTILEDVAHTFSAKDFGFTDPGDADAPNGFAGIKITGINASGYFMLDDGAVNVGDFIDVNDLYKLVFQGGSQQSGKNQLVLEFAVVDDGGTFGDGQDTDQSPNTLAINVTAVNDAPFGTDARLSLKEDTTYHFSAATFGFYDLSDGDSLKQVIINKISSDGDLMLGKKAVHAGQRIDVDDLSSLTFKGDKDDFGKNYASVTFTVVDDGGTANGGINTSPLSNKIVFDLADVVDKITGTAGKNRLIGTEGRDILTGKGGNDTLTGLDGADTFVFRKGAGVDVITDFSAKGAVHDILDIQALSSVASYSDLMKHHIEAIKGGVLIDGLHGDTITLHGVKLGDLDKSDFLI